MSKWPSARSTVPAGLISRYLWTLRSDLFGQHADLSVWGQVEQGLVLVITDEQVAVRAEHRPGRVDLQVLVDLALRSVRPARRPECLGPGRARPCTCYHR